MFHIECGSQPEVHPTKTSLDSSSSVHLYILEADDRTHSFLPVPAEWDGHWGAATHHAPALLEICCLVHSLDEHTDSQPQMIPAEGVASFIFFLHTNTADT